MLDLNNVSKTFNPGTVNEKVALNGMNLHMEGGDFATIVGSNGAGKSTCSTPLPAVSLPTPAASCWTGRDITFQPEFQRSKAIGHLFQDPLEARPPT